MSAVDLVREALEEQVPLRHELWPDWEDVLSRAGVHRPADGASVAPARAGRRPRRRLLVAAALVVLVVAAASPLGPAVAGLGRDAFDGLSSWLRGKPGKPAPAAEQAGFATRNAASYAAFPTGTKLRLLLRKAVGGKTFSLLGFRSGSSLCLRVVRADLAGGRGANQCVTLRELRRSPAPALVASEAWFRFGDPETSADGVFGFADDTVRAVELRRVVTGWSTTAVTSNVFLALRARPTGTVKNHPPFDPIVQVRAVRGDGRRVRVPFVSGDSGDYGRGLPSVPSFLKAQVPRPGGLPGPARATVPFHGGTIGWLERREKRGEPFSLDPRFVQGVGTVLYARAVQPDPESPVRIGMALVRVGPHSRLWRAKERGIMLCESTLEPLGGRGTGISCSPPNGSGLFPAGQPFDVSFMGPTQITRLSGLAADGVAAIDLYLSSGRIVPASLRDNAWQVEAPTTQFPAKLVAYDSRRRPLGIQVLGGAPRPAPCPAPSFGRPRAAQPYERLDLGSRTLAGSPIFGRGMAEVEAALGRPDRIGYFSSTNGVREPTLFYGGTSPRDTPVMVRFGVRKHRLRAVSITVQSAAALDARLGHVLRLRPLELQRRLAAAYGSRYRLSIAYGSQPSRGCIAVFDNPRKTVELTFGVNPYAPTRPFLVLSHGY